MFVRSFLFKGKEMNVDVEPTYTIAKIKELLEEKEGIPVRTFYDLSFPLQGKCNSMKVKCVLFLSSNY